MNDHGTESKRRKWLHRALIVKGIDGGLELIGAGLALVIKPATINRLAALITQHELAQDPQDWLAHRILRTASHSAGTQKFAALYLAWHGLIKIGLVIGLLRHRHRIYPLALVLLSLFAVYQIYRIGYSHSLTLTIFTLFDLGVIWLLYQDWRTDF